MTIQVSTAVDVSLEHSSAATEVPRMREEECLGEREPLSSSSMVEVETLLELLEEQEDAEQEESQSEGDAESNSNTSDGDSHNIHHHNITLQGNLNRRDSDTSDVSSSDGNESNNNSNKAVSPEVAERIISQVETMFSDEHLSKDGFLLKHVRRRSDGFVSLKLVAGLRKVKQISREFPVVMNSLRSSSKLEVNSEGTKIRRIEPLTTMLKNLPTTGQNKEKKETTKENPKEKEVPSTIAPINKDAFADEQQLNRNNNGRNNRNNNRQAQRKMSTVSTGSSNGGSRHGSFSSGKPHPAELFRNVMSCNSSSASGEDSSPQTPRRRGGSLPVATGNSRPSSYNNTSPNSSPPNSFLRPKSNSYCEGQNINGPVTTTMSPWLMKRKQSITTGRNSEGNIVLSGVLRQPRGPDGTKGFASGYRTLILREKETLYNSQTTLSA